MMVYLCVWNLLWESNLSHSFQCKEHFNDDWPDFRCYREDSVCFVVICRQYWHIHKYYTHMSCLFHSLFEVKQAQIRYNLFYFSRHLVPFIQDEVKVVWEVGWLSWLFFLFFFSFTILSVEHLCLSTCTHWKQHEFLCFDCNLRVWEFTIYLLHYTVIHI